MTGRAMKQTIVATHRASSLPGDRTSSTPAAADEVVGAGAIRRKQDARGWNVHRTGFLAIHTTPLTSTRRRRLDVPRPGQQPYAFSPHNSFGQESGE